MTEDPGNGGWRNRIVGYENIDPEQLLANPRNWRIHPKAQQDALTGVLDEIGWVDDVMVNKTTGFVVDGHLRVALALRYDQQSVPVKFIDVTEEEELVILATLDPIAAIAQTDRDLLKDIFEDIGVEDERIEAFIIAVANEEKIQYGELTIPDDRPAHRDLALDFYFTTGKGGLCCVAARMGIGYGTQSKGIKDEGSICPYHSSMRGHKLDFIDNDYFNYNHEKHTAVVELFNPKYATAQDLVTEHQAAKNRINYHSFEQIMDWASELEDHAEHIIVIPKYECIDDIPDQYVLGFSIPTSHGGTLLPPEMFKGRKIHLLGGGWTMQLRYLAYFGEDVVSADNNHLMKIAMFGHYNLPNGGTDLLPFRVTNPFYAASVQSLTNISRRIKELYGEDIPDPLTELGSHLDKALPERTLAAATLSISAIATYLREERDVKFEDEEIHPKEREEHGRIS